MGISAAVGENKEAFPLLEYDDAVFSSRDRVTGAVFELGITVETCISYAPGHPLLMLRINSPCTPGHPLLMLRINSPCRYRNL
jgi:hypothetical protein